MNVWQFRQWCNRATLFRFTEKKPVLLASMSSIEGILDYLSSIFEYQSEIEVKPDLTGSHLMCASLKRVQKHFLIASSETSSFSMTSIWFFVFHTLVKTDFHRILITGSTGRSDFIALSSCHNRSIRNTHEYQQRMRCTKNFSRLCRI